MQAVRKFLDRVVRFYAAFTKRPVRL